MKAKPHLFQLAARYVWNIHSKQRIHCYNCLGFYIWGLPGHHLGIGKTIRFNIQLRIHDQIFNSNHWKDLIRIFWVLWNLWILLSNENSSFSPNTHSLPVGNCSSSKSTSLVRFSSQEVIPGTFSWNIPRFRLHSCTTGQTLKACRRSVSAAKSWVRYGASSRAGLKIRWIRGALWWGGGWPRDTSPGTFQCSPCWEHLRPALSTAAINSTVPNFSDFGPDFRNLGPELRFLWWREVTAGV